MTNTAPSTATFFEGLKVIELASVLAGPAVGMFFAEMGAEVIKIENAPTKGDVTRGWKLPSEATDATYSAYFCAVNWHKKHFFLDLTKIEDQNQVHEWCKDADVVISNFKLSAAHKMKMDYDTIKRINPSIIYAQLTSFGEHDETPAFDIVMQAEAGFLFMTGEPNRTPVKMPVALIDILAAHQLKEAILVGLLHKVRTGQGLYVTASLYDAAVASLANQATNWLMAGHIPQPMGTMHPNIAPYGDIFDTIDSKNVILAIGTDRQFAYLCEILQLSLHLDENYKINGNRVKNRSQLKQKLQTAISKITQEDFLSQCKTKGVPAGRVRNMQEVFEVEAAKELILEEKMSDNRISKRVKSVVFQIRH